MKIWGILNSFSQVRKENAWHFFLSTPQNFVYKSFVEHVEFQLFNHSLFS